MPEALELLDEMEMHIQLNGKPFGVTYFLIFTGYLTILFCEGVLSGNCKLQFRIKAMEFMFGTLLLLLGSILL